MIKIAISGNIASGKSTVQSIISDLGFKVIDTDEIAHSLLDTLSEIKDLFKGYDVIDSAGRFNCTKLGNVVFKNKELKIKLEQIMHPVIKEKILEEFELNSDNRAVFVSVPLLFEANMQDIFDKIIFICCEDSIRLSRLIERNGYSDEYARLRLASQTPQSDKIKLADYVIYNNSDKNELKSNVYKVINIILNQK